METDLYLQWNLHFLMLNELKTIVYLRKYEKTNRELRKEATYWIYNKTTVSLKLVS